MDVRMPVMDGLEAAEILASDAVTGHIPIVAVTADLLGGQDRVRAKRVFVTCLQKPLGSVDVEAAVRRIIGDP
jgi:CheY-like chemotaxis protein